MDRLGLPPSSWSFSAGVPVNMRDTTEPPIDPLLFTRSVTEGSGIRAVDSMRRIEALLGALEGVDGAKGLLESGRAFLRGDAGAIDQAVQEASTMLYRITKKRDVQPVYCSCRRPFDAKDSGCMLQCTVCRGLFHPHCQDMDSVLGDGVIIDMFTCVSCHGGSASYSTTDVAAIGVQTSQFEALGRKKSWSSIAKFKKGVRVEFLCDQEWVKGIVVKLDRNKCTVRIKGRSARFNETVQLPSDRIRSDTPSSIRKSQSIKRKPSTPSLSPSTPPKRSSRTILGIPLPSSFF